MIYLAFISTAILGSLNFLAIELSLYWSLWWFDIVMHLLGGLTGGLLAAWFLARIGEFRVWRVIIAVILVALAWEWFEYIHNIADSTEKSYLLDTSVDLVMGYLGAYLACRVERRVTSRIQGSS